MIDYFVTFLIGVTGSFISAMAGAGVGLFTAYLVLIGLPAPFAVGTSRLGGLGLNVSSGLRFLRSGHIKWQHVLPLSIISVFAAVAGARLLVVLPAELVQTIIGAVLLIIAPLSLLNWSRPKKLVASWWRKIVGSIALFLTVMGQAAFGAGIGGLTSLVYIHLFGFSPLEASATKRLPALLVTIISLAIFWRFGIVDPAHGVALLIGSSFGGYLGAHVAIKKGDQFVKIALALVLLILGIKLLIR